MNNDTNNTNNSENDSMSITKTFTRDVINVNAEDPFDNVKQMEISNPVGTIGVVAPPKNHKLLLIRSIIAILILLFIVCLAVFKLGLFGNDNPSKGEKPNDSGEVVEPTTPAKDTLSDEEINNLLSVMYNGNSGHSYETEDLLGNRVEIGYLHNFNYDSNKLEINYYVSAFIQKLNDAALDNRISIILFEDVIPLVEKLDDNNISNLDIAPYIKLESQIQEEIQNKYGEDYTKFGIN